MEAAHTLSQLQARSQLYKLTVRVKTWSGILPRERLIISITQFH